MQSAAWIGLLQRIPPAQHDNLMLLTTTGMEIALQGVLRVEEEFLVARGRMSGTDQGRILFIPFNQITYLGFQKAVKEVEVRAMFGAVIPEPVVAATRPEAPAPPAPVPEATPSAAEPAPAKAAELPAPPPPPEPAPVPRSGAPLSSGQVRLPDKKAILERLRARSQAGTLKSPLNR
jgi:hypothetical protein